MGKVEDKNKIQQNEVSNGPTRKRKMTDCIFCLLMLGFWAFCVFVMYHGFTNGDPKKLT